LLNYCQYVLARFFHKKDNRLQAVVIHLNPFHSPIFSAFRLACLLIYFGSPTSLCALGYIAS